MLCALSSPHDTHRSESSILNMHPRLANEEPERGRNSPRSMELGSGPGRQHVNLHSEPVVLSLVLGRLRWSCWHPVVRGGDMPEVSVMQKAAPTAKGPQALNAGERKPQTWQGAAGGGRLIQALLSHSSSHACSPHLLLTLPSRPIPPLHNNLHISFTLNSQPNGRK